MSYMTFKTRDLYMAGYFMCEGVNLLNVEQGGNLSYFVFQDHAKCQELELKWANSQAIGDLSVYADKIVKLKKMCRKHD